MLGHTSIYSRIISVILSHKIQAFFAKNAGEISIVNWLQRCSGPISTGMATGMLMMIILLTRTTTVEWLKWLGL
jgi:hypothetical protein